MRGFSVFAGRAAVLSLGLYLMSPIDPRALERTPDVREQLSAIVREFKGVMGIAALDLVGGREIAINAEARFPTASTIKTAVMIEAYHQAAEGRLRLDEEVVLRPEDKVGGSGVLNRLHDGARLTVRDLVHLMIVLSDNTATNLLVAKLGTARIDERLRRYGLRETHLFRPTFRDGQADLLPELEREFGLGMTTPREMASLMAKIAGGDAVSGEASAEMLDTLRRQQDRAMIPRLLPRREGLLVGNKTGTDAEKRAAGDGVHRQVRADAAIVTAPGLRYAIAIYARQVEDPRSGIENDAVTTGARVSRIIFDHFSTAGARE